MEYIDAEGKMNFCPYGLDEEQRFFSVHFILKYHGTKIIFY